MRKPLCVLAIDQGTTSSRAMVFDENLQAVAMVQREFPQIFPREGWVEHDPEAIWLTTLETCRQALREVEDAEFEVAAIGITNQRETSVIWERGSGRPIHNAIVWQDRRTAEFCADLKRQGAEPEVQQRTGLLVDPYFSASKIRWILDNIPGARRRAENGELAFGTIDCFLINRLTGGAVHATDATNASRTSLYNIHTGEWDKDLLKLFDIPQAILPEVRDCIDNFGGTDPQLLGRRIAIRGSAGDQQAAALGQCCFEPGTIKSTYGTGCFVLINTGEQAVLSKNRLLTTIACQLKGRTTYAVEGSIFIAGAAVQWLRDGLGLLQRADQSEEMAEALPDNRGVYLVPAFTGLGAPWWDPDVRGAIFGLTRAAGPKELVRATLESVAYQTYDLFAAIAEDGITPTELRVDGGMVANGWLMQFLADILGMPVHRAAVLETTALGAASLAGIGAGVYADFEQLKHNWRARDTFVPQLEQARRDELLAGWHNAMHRLLGH